VSACAREHPGPFGRAVTSHARAAWSAPALIAAPPATLPRSVPWRRRTRNLSPILKPHPTPSQYICPNRKNNLSTPKRPEAQTQRHSGGSLNRRPRRIKCNSCGIACAPHGSRRHPPRLAEHAHARLHRVPSHSGFHGSPLMLRHTVHPTGRALACSAIRFPHLGGRHSPCTAQAPRRSGPLRQLRWRHLPRAVPCRRSNPLATSPNREVSPRGPDRPPPTHHRPPRMGGLPVPPTPIGSSRSKNPDQNSPSNSNDPPAPRDPDLPLTPMAPPSRRPNLSPTRTSDK
jgi:hypothetical protein